MEQYRVLVVEDDPAIRTGLCGALTASGYITIPFGNGREAWDAISTEIFDLALFDVILPEKSGWELLEHLRKERPTTSAIMLTAKGSETDRIRGLRLGADDYVVKPFSILELLARIEAVLRRSPERPKSIITRIKLPEGEINVDKRELVLSGGKKEVLTPKEFELLCYLASNSKRVISREELLTRVWRMDPRLVETRTIDQTLKRLREKLGAKNAEIITTVHGQGFIWGK